MSRSLVAAATLVAGVALVGGCASNRDGAMDRCRQLSVVDSIPEASVLSSREACLEYLDRQGDASLP